MSGPAHYCFSVFEACAETGELRRQGEIITRQELQQRLWPGHTFVDYDNSLNNAVGRLRQALHDVPYAPRFVETVPRRGYRFIAPVKAHPREQVAAPADAH